MTSIERPALFMARANEKNCEIAGEMADRITEIIFEYRDQIPFVMALGVLRAVEIEIVSMHQD